MCVEPACPFVHIRAESADQEEKDLLFAGGLLKEKPLSHYLFFSKQA
jgi:hypothetical protein